MDKEFSNLSAESQANWWLKTGKSRRVECKSAYMRWNGKRIVRWYHRNPNIDKNLKEIVTGENYLWLWCRYCNAWILFIFFVYIFIFSAVWVIWIEIFISWFSIHKQENWCKVDPLYEVLHKPTLVPLNTGKEHKYIHTLLTTASFRKISRIQIADIVLWGFSDGRKSCL